MPRITAWKCPHTGELFEDQKQYQSHLAKLSRERQRRKKQDQEIANLAAEFFKLQNIEIDISELPRLILEHQMLFWRAAQRQNRWDWERAGIREIAQAPELVKLTVSSLTWSPQVSNTHSCPRGGVTNWQGDPKLPRGYPGWFARLEWQVRWQGSGTYPGGDLFRSTHCGIHIGTGGGGGRDQKTGTQSFAYSVEIFAADWPGLARYREKKLMWDILSAPQTA